MYILYKKVASRHCFRRCGVTLNLRAMIVVYKNNDSERVQWVKCQILKKLKILLYFVYFVIF